MAFFHSLSEAIAKNLRSKLKTITTPLTINTLTQMGSDSIPISSSSQFGVYSNASKFRDQKRGIHVQNEPEEGEQQQQEEDSASFSKIKENLDHPVYGDPMECLTRNIIRVLFNNKVRNFCSSESLLPNNLTLLQLVLIDENRLLQQQELKCKRVDPKAPNAAACSREFFKVAAPCLLHDTDRWVFSRSLVLNEFDSLMNEVQKFTTLDPVGGLRDVPTNIPPGTPDDVVLDNFSLLMDEAVNFYKREPFEMPFIRCTEAFMFMAGDYAITDGELKSRQEVQKLLYELNSEENIAKIHAFDVVCGSAKVIPEKLGVIRDLHLTD